MAIFSPLRMRRKAEQARSEIQRFIAFRLGRQYCALPIDLVVKTAIVESIYTQPHPPHLLMTQYKGKELLLMDLGQKVFNESSLGQHIVDRHILIVRTHGDQAVGVPIDSPPRTFNVVTNSIQEPAASMPPVITGVFILPEDINRYFVLNLASL